jgi:hypothetical protein
MLDHALPDIDSWTLLFSNNGLPVLRVTKRRLEEMRADLDRVDARELARLILQDPIMTVRVLAYIQPLRGRSLQRDITTIASAVMMAGIEPFFHRFSELFTIEDQLKGAGPQALLGVAGHPARPAGGRLRAGVGHLAARHQHGRSAHCRPAPRPGGNSRLVLGPQARPVHSEMLRAHPGMRSADARKPHWVSPSRTSSSNCAGSGTCRNYCRPDRRRQQRPSRVKNVTLAVRLARHSSHGWDDAALPDDFKDIGELLNITPEAVRQRLGLEPMPAREADGQTT